MNNLPIFLCLFTPYTENSEKRNQKRNILFICLFLLLFQILRTQFFKLLLFIKFGRRLFFMKLCHSYLTFVIQLIFSHYVHLLFLSLKRIYSTNIIYLILLK